MTRADTTLLAEHVAQLRQTAGVHDQFQAVCGDDPSCRLTKATAARARDKLNRLADLIGGFIGELPLTPTAEPQQDALL